ncbi:MAG: gliding motility-associated ABC transporter substrate-binding protein GldG [Bacteroidales bacterium]|nr:gliding motility-associated ABC transporter substrate-binding protein GldG [Bacteroidales bacterium]MBR3413318.1 gliding motility-associated ABC transporter substrate-binding protein GldG [Bacteroidales bacterium]
MFTLFKKELASFFTSLIGYLTIIVFLVLTGLMLWVFKSDFNILDYGFASMEGLFVIGPFLYLFLIPAITMRMFAEEKKNGTMELLLTKPLSEMKLIWAKFLAGVVLVLISLLPTVVCYFSVFALGDPVGNIDTGSVVGSYIGLLLLGAAFVAIGLFASSITNNQIVAFILAALMSAFMHLGFEAIYRMGFLGNADLLVRSLGMSYHYDSISRGVVDSRDVVYFASVIAVFMMATRIVLQSRKWHGWRNKKDLRRSHWIELGAGVLIVVFVNVIGYYLFVRLDLTSEKRYTLSKSTKTLLKKVDEPVLFRVYLEGEFPADFKRLQNETKEMLNQFRAYNKNIQYEFVNPNNFDDPQERQVFYQKLAQKGIQPTQIQVSTTGGVTTQVLIPAADVMYKGSETSIQLLQSQKYVDQSQLLNNSIQSLEYVLSNAIRALSRSMRPTVAFMRGHGELPLPNLSDIIGSLYEYYTLDTVRMDENINSLTTRTLNPKDSTYLFHNKYDLIIIAKPTRPFSDRDLYILDQYVMYGGKLLWLVDPLDADLDSLAHAGQAVATRYPLNIEEMLFTYGARINPDLVMDIRCRPIPMTVGMVGDKPQIQFQPWLYFPEIVPLSAHPIVRNLDLIKSDFISSIDLIDNDIDKTVLLTTSEFSRVKNAPSIYDLNEAKIEPDRRLFNRQNIPVAVLLEGRFKSMFRNRLTPDFTELPAMGYRDVGDSTHMIVISDGDIIKNRFNYSDGTGFPLGYDFYTEAMYANKELLLNCVDYLVGDDGAIASRSRDIKIRKLNVMKLKEERTKYQLINILLPSGIILLAGIAIIIIRRKQYRKK